MSKITKIFSVVCVIIFAGLLCFALCGCTEKPDDYTLEEHIERITWRVDERYINAETRRKENKFITGYKLYPLYNNKDQLRYFLIEFEPYGFAFVSINTVSGLFNRTMYKRDDTYICDTWQRYRVCIDGVEPEPDEYRQWLAGEPHQNENFRYEANYNGEFIKYRHSPYAVANVFDQKLYMLDLYRGGVPAIKQGGKYLNLVSLDEFVCEGDRKYYKQMELQFGSQYSQNIPKITFGFIADPYFDL